MTKNWFLPRYYTVNWDEKTGGVKIISNSKHSKGRELKQHIDYHGYLRVKINNRPTKIHQLLGDYLFGQRRSGYTVNHKDGNKLNNSRSNLEYITIGQNVRHAIGLGLHVSGHPERHGKYKDGRTIGRTKEYKHEWYLRKKQNANN